MNLTMRKLGKPGGNRRSFRKQTWKGEGKMKSTAATIVSIRTASTAAALLPHVACQEKHFFGNRRVEAVAASGI